MNRYHFYIVHVMVGIAMVAGACVVSASPREKAFTPEDSGDNKPVWIVLFTSQDCPRCDAVKELLAVLSERYPVHIKAFDVGKEHDYELFRSLERIHAEEPFAVPLVLVGEVILMGDRSIARDLEKIVERLSRSGGAPLPYLGPEERESSRPQRTLGETDHRTERTQMFPFGKELKRIQNLLKLSR